MWRRSIIAAPTGASCSMMTESHFSQPAASPLHVTRWPCRISSALGIGPPADPRGERTPRRVPLVAAGELDEPVSRPGEARAELEERLGGAHPGPPSR